MSHENPLELNERVDERSRVSARLRVVALVGGAALATAAAYLFHEMRESHPHRAHEAGVCEPTGGPHGECRLPPISKE